MLVFLSGIGIAAFHPEGAKFAVFASGRKRASGMSLFNIGGNTGYALGPIVVTPLVLWLGLGPGGLLAVDPGRARARSPCSRRSRTSRGLRPAARRGSAGWRGKDDVRAMVLLGGVIGLRSVAWFGLLTFVPLWVVSLGNSEADGNRLLSLMLLAGAVGTLLLGPIADRFGLRRTLLVAQALLTPMILVFVLVGGLVGAVALMVVGICVVGTFGLTMVLSQMYLPRHVGMASGLSIGLAMGLGGIAAVALGAVADAVDLKTALVCSAFAPLLGVVLCLFLPAPGAAARLRPPRPRHTLCSTDRESSTIDKEIHDDRAGVLRRASLEGRPGQDRRHEQQLRLRHRRRRRLDGDRRRRRRVGGRGRARRRLHDLRERGDADEDRAAARRTRRPPT